MPILDPHASANLRRDWQRRFAKFEGQSIWFKCKYYYRHPQYRTLLYFRLSKALRSRLLQRLFLHRYQANARRHGLEILTERLGGGVIMPHWGRILLNAESIGDNLYVFHNVTVGDDYIGGKPTLGDNVFIGTGAIVIGRINIGNNVLIAAGSVVIHDIPDNCMVAGNPAKVVKALEPDFIEKLLGY